ncbi:hypothetical protein GYH30_000657 [Glycine max]|nr:hypothetical protein GYH30_000657 [Glycine max]
MQLMRTMPTPTSVTPTSRTLVVADDHVVSRRVQRTSQRLNGDSEGEPQRVLQPHPPNQLQNRHSRVHCTTFVTSVTLWQPATLARSLPYDDDEFQL